MTVGQRIAKRRKELGLSQEALGARLGVSRQAIYKWESDAALPEIEKLVNLSREFDLSIDWLLGREDELEQKEPQELTPEQLRMVEEIVGRYLAARPNGMVAEGEPGAQPAGESPAPERLEPPAPQAESETGRSGVRWLKMWGLAWVALAALVVMAGVIFDLYAELKQVKSQYGSLQNSISQVNSNVYSQISGITDRVEEVLQQQNNLAAEQSAEVASTDYRANTLTVAARVLPRTYVEGMEAEFILTSGGETTTAPGQLGEDHAFSAQITGPLSDDVSVSAALISGDQRETQQISQFFNLYTWSLPDLVVPELWGAGNKAPEMVTLDPELGYMGNQDTAAAVDEIRLGLFQEHKLVTWYKLVNQPANYYGEVYSRSWFFQLEGEWTLDPDHTYCLAAVVVDEYGRERVYSSLPARYDPEADRIDDYEWGQDDLPWGQDPAEWDYD